MAVKLETPHGFRERLLLFGGGGAGKTTTVLNIATHLNVGTMHVVDSDYSLAYERAIETEYAEVADRVQVHNAAPDWEDFLATVRDAIAAGDPDTDWLVIDPIGASWDWVQDWALETIYGRDLAAMLVELKREFATDSRAYAAAVSELMNWQIVKREYKKLYRELQAWKGHFILCTEAKAVGGRDDDATQLMFGVLGLKPQGEGSLKHVAATTLFLDHPKRNVWRITTIKDRNRDEVDRMVVEDFGVDYLMSVAGWTRVKGKGGNKGKTTMQTNEKGA